MKQSEQQEQHHILSYTLLAVVLGALLILTGVTVAVSYVDLGYLNIPIALMVASTKATLVLWFFMHLKYEGPAIQISFIATVFFLTIMISFTFWDVAFR